MVIDHNTIQPVFYCQQTEKLVIKYIIRRDAYNAKENRLDSFWSHIKGEEKINSANYKNIEIQK